MIRQHQVTPRVKLFAPSIGVGLNCEERRELVLPRPLKASWERHSVRGSKGCTGEGTLF